MMAFLLSIDCSGQSCSSALVRNDQISAVENLPLTRGHASHILPQIARVVADAGIAMSAITQIVTPVGPGSFTGLRVGLAAARGLALALDIPVTGVRVGDLLIDQMKIAKSDQAWCIAALDGKRAEPFAQCWNPDNGEISSPFTATETSLREHLPAASDIPLMIAGNGSEKLRPLLFDIGHRQVTIVNDSLPDAAQLGQWAWRRLTDGQPLWPPKPLYVRPPDVSQAAAKKAAGQ